MGHEADHDCSDEDLSHDEGHDGWPGDGEPVEWSRDVGLNDDLASWTGRVGLPSGEPLVVARIERSAHGRADLRHAYTFFWHALNPDPALAGETGECVDLEHACDRAEDAARMLHGDIGC